MKTRIDSSGHSSLNLFNFRLIGRRANPPVVEHPGTSGVSSVSPDPLGRFALAGIGTGFLVVVFAQQWGLIEDDSKLPLIMAPLAYFGSALHLWNQNVFGGTVQLGTGFLMPMGSFFAITHVLHVPTWCAERIWIASLLTVACWGVIRLCEALGIGARWARVAAGLAYCMAPIVITLVTTSLSLLAVVFLPWVLQPLVLGSRQGSPRRYAARSGVAVALMGGANAVVVFATLPVAVIWLLTRRPGPRRRALCGWWVIAVGMACFWWIVSSAFVGKYGFDYLPFTETSAVTTSTASAFESLRGASDWIDYYSLGGPLIPGAWLMVSSAGVILGTSVITALGLAGLCRRIPERLFLVTSLAFGVVVITAGYAGSFGGPFSHFVQGLLQGHLAPLRNISKFSPDVALPLVLGLAWILSVPAWSKGRNHVAKFAFTSTGPRGALVVVAVVGLVAAASPYWRQLLYRSDGFPAIPHYWSQAGAWLDTHQGHGNALVVPGSSFANDTWGNPIDVPLQVVDDTSLEWRNVIPIGSNGYIQMLDAVERAIDSGSPSPGLAQFLSRAGIDYVVEQNDLNVTATGAPIPAQVHQVLSESPGLTEVASFGPFLPLRQVEFNSIPIYDSPSYVHIRPVEIFRVDPPTSVVRTYPKADPLVVSGDVGSILSLADDGALNGRAAVLAGDQSALGASTAPGATWAITDGNQRRDLSFGAVRYNASYLLGPAQQVANEPSGIPSGFTVVPGAEHQTVEAPIGAKSVSASSYGSSFLVDEPSQGPAAAFDGNPGTAWVASAQNDSIGQWVSITFNRPLSLSTITVTPAVGSPQQPVISKVTISTDRGAVVRSLPPDQAPVRLRVPAGYSRHLRITIDAVMRFAKQATGEIASGAGIVDVSIPGVSFSQQMRLPDDESKAFSIPSRASPVVALSRPIQNVNLLYGLTFTDDPNLARSFSIPKDLSAEVTGYTLPLPGTALQQILQYILPRASPSNLQVSASSSLGSLPRFRPENMLQKSSSPWVAGLGDKKPTIVLRWQHPQSIDAIRLALSPQASRPTEISLTVPEGSPIFLRVPAHGGLISFAPLVTNTLVMQIVDAAPKVELSPLSGEEASLPVGLASLRIPGLAALPTPQLSETQSVILPCGQGPQITIDGHSYPSSLSGTIGDLLNLKPMRFSACLPGEGLSLKAGTHSFEANSFGSSSEITSVVMRDIGSGGVATATPPRSVHVLRWSAEYRTVTIGPGSAAYFAVAQNYDSGWTATLNGKSLTPLRLDGWQQGFVIPAGGAGVITMVMAPDRLFRFLLFLGAILLICLFVLAFLPSRRRVDDTGGPGVMCPRWVLLGGGVAILVVVSGPLALIAIPLILACRRWGAELMATVAFGAFVTAGVVAAWNPASLTSQSAAAFSGPAQIASVVALAAVLIALAFEMDDSRGEPPNESAPTELKVNE